MDDFFAEALRMFDEESNDVLERAERALLALADQPSVAEIGALFRDVHTLKGSARVMGFSTLERVAHVMEDVVSQLRDEGRPLDAAIVDALLAAVDELRRCTAAAVAARQDVHAPSADEQVAALRALHAGWSPAPSSAPSPVDSSKTLPSLDDGWDLEPPKAGALATESRDHGPLSVGPAAHTSFPRGPVSFGVDSLAPAEPESSPTFRDDARVSWLGEVEASLVALERGLGAWLQGDSADERAAVALDLLESGAKEHGFGALFEPCATLRALRDAPNCELHESAESALFEALVDAQEVLADELGVDADRVSRIRHLHRMSALPRIGELTGRLRALAATPGPHTVERIGRALTLVQHACKLLGRMDLAFLAIGVSDELAQAEMEGAPFDEAAAARVHAAADELERSIGSQLAVGSVAPTAAIAPVAEAPSPTGDPDRLESLSDLLVLFEPHLTEQTSAALDRAIAELTPLYVVRGDPSADGAAAGRLMDFLQREPQRTLCSRTLVGGTIGFDFLFASALPPAELRRALAEVDPEGSVFRLAYPPAPAAEQLLVVPMATPEFIEPEPVSRRAAGEPRRPRRRWSLPPGKAPASEAKRAPASTVAPSSTTMAPGGESRGPVLKVPAERVEALLDLVRELSLAAGATVTGVRREHGSPELAANAHRLQGLVSELQDAVTGLALVPLQGVFQRVQRAARDAARSSGKELTVLIEGGETEVDKSVGDRLAEPLLHLVRNAVDHGVESAERRAAAGKSPIGKITIAARSDGAEVRVIVRDDGAGLDRDRILARGRERGLVRPDATPSDDEVWALIFEAGFSTAAQVTELSGRGVGMDVVRTQIGAIGGRVHIDTRPGRGTEFRLVLPLSVAFLDSIIARVDSTLYAIPTTNVRHMLRPSAADRGRIGAGRRDWVRFEGEVLTLCELPRIHQQHVDAPPVDSAPVDRPVVVVLENGQRTFGLGVDELLGHEQVVVKPLSTPLRSIRAVRACGLLSSGDVALVLDCERLQTSYH